MGMWELGAPDIPPKTSWGIPTPQHTTHIRHQYGWGERSIHHKWDSKEEIIQYTQHLKKIATRQLTFIGKVARNSDDYLPTKLLTTWCNHKRRRGGVLHTNKKNHRSQPPNDHTRSGKIWSAQNMGALYHQWQIMATLNFRPWNLLNINPTFPPPSP